MKKIYRNKYYMIKYTFGIVFVAFEHYTYIFKFNVNLYNIIKCLF